MSGMDNSGSIMIMVLTVWKVTYHDNEGTWAEAIVIPKSLGLNNQNQVRQYLELERLEDYSLRDRTIENLEQIEDQQLEC